VSSEESDKEDAADYTDGNKCAVIAIKPLAWRVPKVVKCLDHKITKRNSKQSKQQMLPRVIGRQSSTARPSCLSDDFAAP